MAHTVNQLISSPSSAEDRILVLCGNGHMGYGHGVPERIFKRHPTLKSEATSVYSRPTLLDVDESEGGLVLPEDMSKVLHGALGAAEFCLIYQDTQAVKEAAAEAEAARIKEEVRPFSVHRYMLSLFKLDSYFNLRVRLIADFQGLRRRRLDGSLDRRHKEGRSYNALPGVF